MMSAGGGRGGDAHVYKRSLLYFDRSDLSCNLYHVDDKREGAMEVLIILLYNRVYGRVSTPDLTRIFISLEVGTGGVG